MRRGIAIYIAEILPHYEASHEALFTTIQFSHLYRERSRRFRALSQKWGVIIIWERLVHLHRAFFPFIITLSANDS